MNAPISPKAPDIAAGQVWRDNSLLGGGTFRIMAVAERYAMARRKGCMPFVIAFGDLRKRATLTVQP